MAFHSTTQTRHPYRGRGWLQTVEAPRIRFRQRAQNRGVARDSDQPESAPASIMARIEAFEKITKTAALAGFCGIGLVLLGQNYEPARQALHDLFELTPRIKQVNVPGLVVAFDESTVGSGVKVELNENDPRANDPTYIDKLTGIIQSLEPDHYKRLLYVDTLRDLCKFENSTVDVDYKFSLDQDLEERGLVKLTESPALLKEINGKRGSQQGETIEHPRFCYAMSYTELGYDAKTAIVNTMIKYVKTARH